MNTFCRRWQSCAVAKRDGCHALLQGCGVDMFGPLDFGQLQASRPVFVLHPQVSSFHVAHAAVAHPLPERDRTAVDEVLNLSELSPIEEEGLNEFRF